MAPLAPFQGRRLTLALELKDASVSHRHFISLPEKQQNLLRAQFPELRELAEGGAAGCHQLAVSVFDHWLSPSEAVSELNGVDLESQTNKDAKLAAFARSLASRHQCYLVKFKGRYHQHPTFRIFTSDEACHRWLTPLPYNIGDKGRFCLAFPQLEMVYFEGHDFTHHLYYKGDSGKPVVEKAAADAGLYLL
ncbi:hypothetical protein [Marinobacter sp.]|uniref:hypothetical protein n=1 Tax=Marinobacter sp. TaxID=50741 RepID=UPI0034A1FFBE